MKTILFALAAFLLSGCGAAKNDPDTDSGKYPYTLYRSGVIAKDVKIPVAKFDTNGERVDWNKENCEKVAGLMNGAQRVEQFPVKFWCEKGKAGK